MFSTAGLWMACSSIRGGGASGGGFSVDTGGTPDGLRLRSGLGFGLR